jgi:hypothetical protein
MEHDEHLLGKLEPAAYVHLRPYCLPGLVRAFRRRREDRFLQSEKLAFHLVKRTGYVRVVVDEHPTSAA